jgi:hypothetical protein
MRLFFGLSAAMGFVVMGADTAMPTPVAYSVDIRRIDDAYAGGRSRHGS